MCVQFWFRVYMLRVWFSNTEIWLGNQQDNFQLHRFTKSKNIARSFRDATFLTQTVIPIQLIIKIC